MRLHKIDYYEGYPCGAVALSILNRKMPWENICAFLQYRSRQKPYKNEWVKKKEFYNDRSILYFKEAKHFFSPYFGKNKIKSPKTRPPLKHFIGKLKPKKTYLVWTDGHLQIIKDKKIWDTCGLKQPIEYHSWPNARTNYFVELLDKKAKKNYTSKYSAEF